jgi:NarL family two-component system response regulator LiaR
MAFKTSGLKHLAIYGACGGLLIVAMRFVEYRFLVVQHSFEIYAALIAAAFATVGIWLGLTITRRVVVVKEIPVPTTEPFVADTARIEALGITPRELQVLQLIAEGLSTKEMADRLFVSENTVKTHTGRVLDKLGASRRTQAVQLAKHQRIIA